MERKYLSVITNTILIITIIFFVYIAVTYSIKSLASLNNLSSYILEIDEEVYGSNRFDNSNLDLRPILDNRIQEATNQVIYINFVVGGNIRNNIDHIIYDIALVDLEMDCELLSSYLKWKLIKNGEELSNGSFDYQFDTIENGRLVLTNIQQDLKPYCEDKSTYDYYQLYIWLSDSCQFENMVDCMGDTSDQTMLLNKRIKGKVEVELYAKNKEPLVRKPSNTLPISTCYVRDGDEK